MDPLLDALTLAPTAQLFELEPPKYTSSYGRRTEAIFKNNVPPAPMLISPDNGLVLYERVISTKAEHQLLDKLTKPKYYHPIPNIKKDRKGPSHSNHAGTSPQRPASASGRPGSPHGQGGPGGHPHPSGGTTPCAAPSAAGGGARAANHPPHHQQPQPQHHARSQSAGRTGPGLSHPVKRKPLYPEDGPLKDYFSKERASVTATTMFTWGNRYRIGEVGTGRVVGGGAGGGGGGGRGSSGVTEASAFSSYAPLQQKPPLRL